MMVLTLFYTFMYVYEYKLIEQCQSHHLTPFSAIKGIQRSRYNILCLYPIIFSSTVLMHRTTVVTSVFHIPVRVPVPVILTLKFYRKVQAGKDQEKAQSERDSHSKNRGGKKPN